MPVLMCTEATFEIGMLSSLLPKNRDLVRITRCGLTTRRVGNRKFPCVQREAEKVSAGEESIGLSVGIAVFSNSEAQVRQGTAGVSLRSKSHRFSASAIFFYTHSSAPFCHTQI